MKFTEDTNKLNNWLSVIGDEWGVQMPRFSHQAVSTIFAEIEELFYPKPRVIKQTQPGYIYLLKSEAGHYKIGRTKNMKERQARLRIQLPFSVETVCSFWTKDMIGAERDLHKKYAHCRLNGEWFNLTEQEAKEIQGYANAAVAS